MAQWRRRRRSHGWSSPKVDATSGRHALAVIYAAALLAIGYAVILHLSESSDLSAEAACQDALERRYEAQTIIWRTGGDSPDVRTENLRARTDLAIAERDITALCTSAR